MAEGMGVHLILTVRDPLRALHGQNIQPRYPDLQHNHGGLTNENWILTKKMEGRAKWNAGKILGNYNAQKLRIILLFKADFNANNKWLGQAVMMNAETLELLADKQYGSWQHKAAILQCLDKGLIYDILWQGKRPVALCSNDAKSCYDQITLLAAALSLCQLGATIPVVQSMVKMIHRMQHHICTAYGDSQQAAGRMP